MRTRSASLKTCILRFFICFLWIFNYQTRGFGQVIVFDEVRTVGNLKDVQKIYPSPKVIYLEAQEHYIFCYFHLNSDSEKLKIYFTIDSASWDQEVTAGQPVFLSNLPLGTRSILNVRAKNEAGKIVATNFLEINVDSPFWTKWWVKLLLFTFILGLISLVVFFYTQQNIRQIRQTYLLRERMHQDLHDEMGTSLGSINLLINHLKKKITAISTSEITVLFDEVETQIRNTHEEMRDLMWAIKPTNNKAEHIVKKIYAACANLLTPANIGFQINESGDLEKFALQLNQNYQLVRFVKEAIYNIVKHARAEWVDISVGLSEQRFYLIIQDNGVGFDTELETEGTGMSSFQNRALSLKGQLSIESVAGEGTTITLSFPVFN